MKYYIGVDLGGTNIVSGVVNERYEIIYKQSIKTEAQLSFEKIIANIGRLIDDVITKSGIRREEISSVGMGTPSYVDPATGLLIHANNLNWRNVPLYQELKKYVDYPLYIGNDADCAALGEALAGAAKDQDNALMITLGTGVGGGMIIGKKIFRGCDRLGAEFGHTKLVFDGIMCTCGQKGCFESYASATALINQTRVAIWKNPQSLMMKMCSGRMEKVNGKTAFDAAKAGDAVAAGVIQNYIDYLAAGLSSLICAFRPDIIIIGGGIGGEKEFLIKPLNEKLVKSTFAGDIIGVPEAVPAALGNDAGVIGAAMLEVSEKD